jgi:hypothetical protein
VEESRTRGILKLEGLEGRVEVGGRRHVVKVIGGGAELKEGRGGRKLLRIKITAEVDGVRRVYVMTYGRHGADNAAVGRAYASANAPGGRQEDAKRIAALVKALTGREPRIIELSDGEILIECYEGHLEGFRRFAELADDIEKWLEETARRA